MPKIVDHNQRRQELIEATWRVIARHGLSGTTMRQIANEAGYANGALKPYFPTRSDLLGATYDHVFGLTETRIDEAVQGLRGLEALRVMALEILPVTPYLQEEALLVLSFWDVAGRDPEKARRAVNSMNSWRDRLFTMLTEASEDGVLREGLNFDSVVGVLLGFLQGSQINAVADPGSFSPEQLRAHLEGHLDMLQK